jgi:uncharacterized protein YrzB (UPF0473 family)
MADLENNLNPEEEEVDVVELIDENGDTVLFEHMATLEHEGETYLAMTPYVEDASEEAEEVEISILKIEQDENGEDIYTTPSDEEQEAVFGKLMKLIDEMDQE